MWSLPFLWQLLSLPLLKYCWYLLSTTTVHTNWVAKKVLTSTMSIALESLLLQPSVSSSNIKEDLVYPLSFMVSCILPFDPLSTPVVENCHLQVTLLGINKLLLLMMLQQ